MKSKTGLFLVLTDDAELVSTLVHLQPKGMDVKVWCPAKEGRLQEELLDALEGVKDLDDVLTKGDFTKPAYFQQWKDVDPVCVVLAFRDEDLLAKARERVASNLPEAIILSFRHGHPRDVPRTLDNERELVLTWAELLARPVGAELRHIQSTHMVKEVREILDPGDKIALLLQPDPDPDGLAAALALRNVLGRNKVSTPIVTFGKVTRPENLAMMRLLDIEVSTVRVSDLASFDRVAMLDTQPAHFKEDLGAIHAVIDHHPSNHSSYDSIPYVDIRPQYGATSTILTEYLKAAACPIGQRLATALLYGIKADTLHLNREVIDADLDAYVSLYPNINYNLLRRIEKPELPMRFAPVLADALRTMATDSGVLVVCLGSVEREDLIPQVADFLLQFEDVEWVVAAGFWEGSIVMSVRNVGYVKNAGDVVKRIINGWGLGGGHRTMAKAIFPMAEWKTRFGTPTASTVRDITLRLFVEEAL
ncbi:MAG: DHH family phosphoesterase [Silvanigrellales bacterium]|jgi:nanoRNase/pAp phosphatase (c-di-AMP/oligoRNAs hydrolase)|nr:DHH family phosphoesterase [Silvanigrellales bacterium]